MIVDEGQITGIVLAGGKSSRMGTDKGLLVIDGQPMVKYILDTLDKVCEQIFIVTNNELYDQFGYPLIEDRIKDKGPLMGVVSGLMTSSTSDNFIVSCDAPNVSLELLLFLFKNRGDNEVVVAKKSNQIHPLIGYYHKGVLPTLQEKLSLNELKLLRTFDSLNVLYLNCDQFLENEFKNINSRIDI